ETRTVCTSGPGSSWPSSSGGRVAVGAATRDVVRTWLSIRGYLVSAGHGTYCWLPSSSPVESVLPSTGWDLRCHLSTRPPTAAAGQSRNRPDETECETQ